jgi:aquaporin Z
MGWKTRKHPALGEVFSLDFPSYRTFQIMGGVLAALAVRFLKGGGAVAPLHPATVPALLAEFLFTLRSFTSY